MGEVDVLIDAAKLGYLIIDPTDVLGSRSHVPHVLLHRGFHAEAEKFLSEFPEHLNTSDRWSRTILKYMPVFLVMRCTLTSSRCVLVL